MFFRSIRVRLFVTHRVHLPVHQAVERCALDRKGGGMEEREKTPMAGLFREIFEHVATGIAVYEAVDDGEDFIFKDINPAGARIGRLPREAHLGRRVTEVYPGVEALGLLEVFRDVFSTGIPKKSPRFQIRRRPDRPLGRKLRLQASLGRDSCGL